MSALLYSLLDRANTDHPRKMGAQFALASWLSVNRPELRQSIGKMTLDEVRQRLNAETGLDVQPDCELETAWAQYLDAFQEADHVPRA